MDQATELCYGIHILARLEKAVNIAVNCFMSRELIGSYY